MDQHLERRLHAALGPAFCPELVDDIRRAIDAYPIVAAQRERLKGEATALVETVKGAIDALLRASRLDEKYGAYARDIAEDLDLEDWLLDREGLIRRVGRPAAANRHALARAVGHSLYVHGTPLTYSHSWTSSRFARVVEIALRAAGLPDGDIPDDPYDLLRAAKAEAMIVSATERAGLPPQRRTTRVDKIPQRATAPRTGARTLSRRKQL